MLLNDIDTKKKYLLAVSGGIDSMVMCDVFLQNKITFGVAHCNFQLRGEESDGDENLVKEWCEKNNISFFTKKMGTKQYADENKLSIQVAARELRYHFFYELIEKESFDFIATAHHQNDNIETVLFHFFRGTGIQGMTGIPSKNNKTSRPLLHISKKEIISYAQENKIAYRDDSSNQKTDYTRNKLRNDIIPQLEEIFPAFKNNIARNIARFHDVNMLYREQADRYKKKLLEQRGKDFFIPLMKLKHVNPLSTILYELLKPFGFSFEQSEQAVLLIESETGHMIENATHRLFKNRNFFIITEKNTIASEIILIENDAENIHTADFELIFKTEAQDNFQLQKDFSVCQADQNLLEFPLILRKWRQGDYMYPLGMKKKKKVSRILIDMKIPLHEKENTWVIESNKKIVWLAGLKMDERFKVAPATNKIFIIHLKKSL